ncbi:MAG: metal-dependent transcriptional regulator [Eubacteriales bacterium]|nr:metal-dependent transcriptional regulator [Eubacteriales bacterium]MDD3198246.1 metal-dependent transcriptional regulator [Eubacteriales bacterium]MDD3503288.1 metal-dependent transcriptional regulator [Eubacteriales bacterium]MDD4681810.1 metal-dependent transcriptional regulator [Eubacteriales bacterium]
MSSAILTPASEDYLEAILLLSDDEGRVRSVDIAEHLHVSKASVSKAIGILKQAELISHDHYGLIQLTAEGKIRAREIMQRHTMLKRFLTEVLHIDEETAEQDACRMEHAISEVTKEKWLQYLSRVL